MSAVHGRLRGLVVRYVSGLRFPYLLALTAGLFVIDFFVPDVIPYADEILLGLATIILARLKRTDAGNRR